MRNILILTIDCWNKNTCAGSASSYSSLFSQIDEYHISNIYIREELPDDSCCSRYFQISEQQIIKSVFNKKITTGKEVSCEELPNEENTAMVSLQRNLYARRAHFYYTKKAIREIIWWCSAWKSRELDAFIESVDPEVIIFTMEGYIHFNRLCRYVLKKTKAKSIGYFWDDNFTYKQRPKNFGYKVIRFFQRKSLRRLAKETTAFWAISPKTKKEADNFFGISCDVIYKPAAESEACSYVCDKNKTGPLRMLYTGNLAIGRMNTLKMVAEILQDLNRDQIKICLDVYSPTQIPEELKNFGHGITFYDPVPQNKIVEIQRKTDILLFIEDLEEEERLVSRLSFSTKIPDYLISGKCIIAIADNDTAPMEYFKQQQAALCASTADELRQHIENVLEQPSIMQEYGKRAFACAQKNHNKRNIQEKIKSSINAICDQREYR